VGTLGILARLVALAAILLVSFLLVETIVSFGSSSSELLGVTAVPTSPPIPEVMCPLGDLFFETDILINLQNRPTFFPVGCCFHIWCVLMPG
jgi:hypothetical protein